MAVKIVKLSNTSRVTRRTATVESDGKLGMSRELYQKLGSLVQNKTISEDYMNGRLSPDYVRILDDLNNLLLHQSYGGISIVDLPPLAPYIEELDRYLGSLGLEATYHYAKDSNKIPVWLDSAERAEVRYLTETTISGQPFDFVLMDGDEILVSY